MKLLALCNSVLAKSALFAVGLCLAHALASQAASINDGLLAHWRHEVLFPTSTSPNVVDVRGSHHAEILPAFDSPTLTPGQLGNAYDYEADDVFVVNVQNSAALNTGNAVTVAAWITPESFRAGTGAGSRNGILGDSSTNFIFSLEEQGRLRFTYDTGGNNFQSILTDVSDAVSVGAATHVAATRNAGDVRLYINGQEVKQETLSPANIEAFGTMQMGRVNNTSARNFDGEIDDLRYYERALSATEVGQLAALQQATLTASEDTYINVNNAAAEFTTNFGAEETIRVGPGGPGGNGEKQGLVKFDLSSLPTNIRIENVTLQGLQSDGIILPSFDVFQVTSDWDEGLVTGATAPASVGAALGQMTLNGSATLGGFSFLDGEDDLTALVQGWLDGSIANHGLLLTGDGDTLRSTETSVTGAFGPQLVIEYSTIPEPSSLVLLGLGLFGLATTNRRRRMP